LFVWEECGRSFVTRFGALSVSVKGQGSLAKGSKRWRVADIFGNLHLGGGWKSLDDAILEAEALAVREGTALLGNVRRKVIPGRRMPKLPP
jgi:hypothetical protein